MARRRYQKGSLRLRGTRNKMWTLRWREDVLEPNGAVRRVERTTVLGTLKDIPTRRIAERRAELILAQVNRPDYKPVKVSTFAEFVERWRTQALALMKPSTAHAAQSHLRCYLLPRLGKFRLEEITQEVVQSLVAELAKRASRHTILNVLGTLGSILASARQWGYVVSIFRRSDLKIPATRAQGAARYFTAEQARAIIEAAGQPWRTIFTVAAMTGLRPGEVLGLSTDDLDFEQQLIHVRRSAWYSKLQSPKNQSSVAAVPMPRALEAALRDYLSVWRPNPQRLLFATRTGKPISRNFIVEHKLRRILDALGIRRCGMHGFRHTHASLLVSMGASPVVAQRQLRHADPMTTLRNYTHVLGDEQRQAVERVAEILRPDVAKSSQERK